MFDESPLPPGLKVLKDLQNQLFWKHSGKTVLNLVQSCYCENESVVQLMTLIHRVGYKNNQADQNHDFDLHICYTYLLKLTVDCSLSLSFSFKF